MASQWANSFDLLDSGADAPAAAPKASKKRKSKKKASNSGQETSQTIYLQQDAPQRQQVAEEAKHDDFTPVERRAAPKRASSAASLLPSRAQDAAAALEKATVDGARSSLVVDWNEQVCSDLGLKRCRIAILGPVAGLPAGARQPVPPHPLARLRTVNLPMSMLLAPS